MQGATGGRAARWRRPGRGSPRPRCRRSAGGCARSGRGTPARAGRRARPAPRWAAEPNAVSGAAAARARLANSRPIPDVRRSSWAITSAIGTARASATAVGMARSRNGSPSASATRGPMTLPPGSERRRERDDECHRLQSATGRCHAARDSRRGRPDVVRAHAVGTHPGADRGRRSVRSAALVVAWFVPWQLTVLVGVGRHRRCSWWRGLARDRPRSPPSRPRSSRLREDDTRAGTHLLLLGAALVSLVGVVLAFLKANETGIRTRCCSRALGVFTIACSWVLVHTVFALRYAHVYYTDRRGRDRLQDQGDERPDYRDFAYTAFTVGMTFQVSDTDITQRDDAPRGAAARAALVPVRRGDPGDHGQRDRQPAEHSRPSRPASRRRRAGI